MNTTSISLSPSISLHISHLPILDLFLIIVVCTQTHTDTRVCVWKQCTHVHRNICSLLNQLNFVHIYMCPCLPRLTTQVWTTYVGAHPCRKPILPLSRDWPLKMWNFPWPGRCDNWCLSSCWSYLGIQLLSILQCSLPVIYRRHCFLVLTILPTHHPWFSLNFVYSGCDSDTDIIVGLDILQSLILCMLTSWASL